MEFKTTIKQVGKGEWAQRKKPKFPQKLKAQSKNSNTLRKVILRKPIKLKMVE